MRIRSIYETRFITSRDHEREEKLTALAFVDTNYLCDAGGEESFFRNQSRNCNWPSLSRLCRLACNGFDAVPKVR